MLLVLVPGLIFFVSQVALLVNRMDWFAWMGRRAAYALIVPVLVIWIWKRKFPVWGLVPLGLLFSTFLTSFWYHFEVLGVICNTNPIIVWLNEQTQGLFTPAINKALAITLLICTIGLIWLLGRCSSLSHMAWVWLGVYSLLVILNFWANYNFQVETYQKVNGGFLHTILIIAYFGFYSYGGYLVLILLGTLPAKRHGKLTLLLLLGFLLPALISGKQDWVPLVYRFFSGSGCSIVDRPFSNRQYEKTGWSDLISSLTVNAVSHWRTPILIQRGV